MSLLHDQFSNEALMVSWIAASNAYWKPMAIAGRTESSKRRESLDPVVKLLRLCRFHNDSLFHTVLGRRSPLDALNAEALAHYPNRRLTGTSPSVTLPMDTSQSMLRPPHERSLFAEAAIWNRALQRNQQAVVPASRPALPVKFSTLDLLHDLLQLLESLILPRRPSASSKMSNFLHRAVLSHEALPVLYAASHVYHVCYQSQRKSSSRVARCLAKVFSFTPLPQVSTTGPADFASNPAYTDPRPSNLKQLPKWSSTVSSPSPCVLS
ncbi:hypothetical protein KC343_g73 [Hortaea werneckii]|nr:hypothetical protein KC317_g72 [Hortaea werneckii]KAI7628707.1 hypothetical protein KC346_g77 [Hortaea werneckii]KAI7638519.1 hypothetical protein KC343_g73 [Hortaea werneckii]